MKAVLLCLTCIFLTGLSIQETNAQGKSSYEAFNHCGWETAKANGLMKGNEYSFATLMDWCLATQGYVMVNSYDCTLKAWTGEFDEGCISPDPRQSSMQ